MRISVFSAESVDTHICCFCFLKRKELTNRRKECSVVLPLKKKNNLHFCKMVPQYAVYSTPMCRGCLKIPVKLSMHSFVQLIQNVYSLRYWKYPCTFGIVNISDLKFDNILLFYKGLKGGRVGIW